MDIFLRAYLRGSCHLSHNLVGFVIGEKSWFSDKNHIGYSSVNFQGYLPAALHSYSASHICLMLPVLAVPTHIYSYL